MEDEGREAGPQSSPPLLGAVLAIGLAAPRLSAQFPPSL